MERFQHLSNVQPNSRPRRALVTAATAAADAATAATAAATAHHYRGPHQLQAGCLRGKFNVRSINQVWSQHFLNVVEQRSLSCSISYALPFMAIVIS